MGSLLSSSILSETLFTCLSWGALLLINILTFTSIDFQCKNVKFLHKLCQIFQINLILVISLFASLILLEMLYDESTTKKSLQNSIIIGLFFIIITLQFIRVLYNLCIRKVHILDDVESHATTNINYSSTNSGYTFPDNPSEEEIATSFNSFKSAASIIGRNKASNSFQLSPVKMTGGECIQSNSK